MAPPFQRGSMGKILSDLKSVSSSVHLRRSAAAPAVIFFARNAPSAGIFVSWGTPFSLVKKVCATAHTRAGARLRQQPYSSARSAPPAGGFCVIGNAVSCDTSKKAAGHLRDPSRKIACGLAALFLYSIFSLIGFPNPGVSPPVPVPVSPALLPDASWCLTSGFPPHPWRR